VGPHLRKREGKSRDGTGRRECAAPGGESEEPNCKSKSDPHGHGYGWNDWSVGPVAVPNPFSAFYLIWKRRKFEFARCVSNLMMMIILDYNFCAMSFYIFIKKTCRDDR